ncbi:phosphotransferase enzyme family protein [Paraphaeosphaeria sporulosa]
MTVFDELAETDGDNEFRAWLSKVIDAKQEIVAFVASRRQGKPAGEFDGYLKGSFNLSLVIRFSNGGPKAVIRFPKPGHTATAFRDEKVSNEVQFLKFLSEKTTIPVPRVVSWGMIEDSPQHLGPFIIMDYVDETEQDEVILATDVDDMKLDYVYEQLADYMLQLSRLDFSTIGAISKSPSSNRCIASERPLTYNMNELNSVVSNYPISGYPTAPFTSAKAFLHSLAEEHLVHLRTQRNLANDREDAKKRFIARHRFKELISHYCLDDTGPFKPYCDDLQPTNMLAHPDTLHMWLENHSMEDFMIRYVPRLEQFLRALERVEARTNLEGSERNPLLSVRMRDSWATGRLWFDYGIRKSFDIDAVYWAALHKDGDDVLNDKMREEMEKLVDLKMEQLKAYDAECKVRFSS